MWKVKVITVREKRWKWWQKWNSNFRFLTQQRERLSYLSTLGHKGSFLLIYRQLWSDNCKNSTSFNFQPKVCIISGSVVIFHETPRVKKGPYFHASNVWVFVKVVHKCICCSFPLHREEPIFLMSEGNDIPKKRSYVKFGIWLICQIWHTDGYGSTPSAWVYSQFLPSGKLKIIILTKNFIILLFYSKSWKSWMAMYWALWWCYSSFEAKKTLSSSVTLWCNGLWRHTKGPSLLRTLEKFYSIEIEIKTEIDHWKYLSLSRLLAPLTLITNI